MARLIIALVCMMSVSAVFARQAAAPKKETVDGVRNFTNVDPTIACAGATEARVIPELAKRGYKAIINLRQVSEEGSDIDASRTAAQAAGIRFIHLPINPQQPDPATADAFLKVVADPANQPTYINCLSAGRVSALLITKRMLLDGWSEARALEEAAIVGPPNAVMQKFALDYVASRKK